MPAITITDLNNAKLDVDHIAAIATSTSSTATDRLGHVKKTISGAVADIDASITEVQEAVGTAQTAINAGVTQVEEAKDQSLVYMAADVLAVENAKNTFISTELPAAVTAFNEAASTVLLGLGYLPPVAYTTGLSMTDPAQTVGYLGETYAPKATEIPFTTSGTFEATKFRLIQGVAITDLGSSAGAGLVGFVNSTADAVPTTALIKLRETVNVVSDYGAVPGGITDASPAFLAALNATKTTGQPVIVPPGIYRLSTRVDITNSDSGLGVYCNMQGAGVDKTIFVVDGDENPDGAFRFYKNGVLFNVTLSGFTVLAKSGSGNCGTALHCEAVQTGSGAAPKLTIKEVEITTEDELVPTSGGVATPAYWTKGITAIKVGRPLIREVVFNNPKVDTTNNLIRYADSSVNYLGFAGIDVSDCYAPKLERISVSQCTYGVYAYSTTPVEAFRFEKSQCVNVKQGICLDKNSSLVTGVEPGLDVSGSHIAYRDVGIYINGRGEGNIKDILFYGQTDETGAHGADPVDIWLQQSQQMTIANNTFGWDNLRSRKGIYQVSKRASAADGQLTVYGNTFSGTFLYAIHCEPAVGKPSVGTNNYSAGVLTQLRFSSQNKKGPYTSGLYSDTYTPTVVSSVNVAASTPQLTSYCVIGDVVSFAGRISITPTANNTLTEVHITPPVQGTLTADADAGGTVVQASASASCYGSALAASGNIVLRFMSVNMVTGFYYFNVQYRIRQ